MPGPAANELPIATYCTEWDGFVCAWQTGRITAKRGGRNSRRSFIAPDSRLDREPFNGTRSAEDRALTEVRAQNLRANRQPFARYTAWHRHTADSREARGDGDDI